MTASPEGGRGRGIPGQQVPAPPPRAVELGAPPGGNRVLVRRGRRDRPAAEPRPARPPTVVSPSASRHLGQRPHRHRARTISTGHALAVATASGRGASHSSGSQVTTNSRSASAILASAGVRLRPSQQAPNSSSIGSVSGGLASRAWTSPGRQASRDASTSGFWHAEGGRAGLQLMQGPGATGTRAHGPA